MVILTPAHFFPACQATLNISKGPTSTLIVRMFCRHVILVHTWSFLTYTGIFQRTPEWFSPLGTFRTFLEWNKKRSKSVRKLWKHSGVEITFLSVWFWQSWSILALVWTFPRGSRYMKYADSRVAYETLPVCGHERLPNRKISGHQIGFNLIQKKHLKNKKNMSQLYSNIINNKSMVVQLSSTARWAGSIWKLLAGPGPAHFLLFFRDLRALGFHALIYGKSCTKMSHSVEGSNACPTQPLDTWEECLPTSLSLGQTMGRPGSVRKLRGQWVNAVWRWRPYKTALRSLRCIAKHHIFELIRCLSAKLKIANRFPSSVG